MQSVPEARCRKCGAGLIPQRRWTRASELERASWKAEGYQRAAGAGLCHRDYAVEHRAGLRPRRDEQYQPQTPESSGPQELRSCHRCGQQTWHADRICDDCWDVVTPDEYVSVWADENARLERVGRSHNKENQ